MSISISGDLSSTLTSSLTQSSATSKSSALESKLSNGLEDATDEETMEVCKDFEAYLLEQMFKEMEKTVKIGDDDEENEYMEYFGDMQYQQYAEQIADSGQLGIAQMLYESMKNN